MTSAPDLHTTEIGDTGERVVFLHGLFGQGRNFTQVAKALQPELRSTLVDLPNHGRSAWTGSVDYVDVADAVATWLRAAYDGEPVHLVGHSMGGKVAMVLALRHPELIDRLVVVDISPAPSGGAGEFEHLLTSLTGLDLDGLERRSDADEQLAGSIPDERVRGFLLQQLAAGAQDEQIARRLGVSLRTVRRRVADVMSELGAESRFQAGVEAAKRGWI